jgi:radical SAM protein with 4Fe4S-binding SPASM domain
MDVEQWKHVIDKLHSFGVKNMTATGGEPLLREDLLHLFMNIRKNKTRTNIITNGTLISDANIESIRDAFDEVTVSLDSHIHSVNDLNRGVGTYSSTIKAIHLLEKMSIPYSINAVLTTHNIDHFVKMKEYFQEYKHLTGIAPITYQSGKIKDPLCASYSQIDEHYGALFQHLLSNENCASIASNPKQGLLLLRNGCGVGKCECAIGPDGTLYPCRALYFQEFNAGNVYENDIHELWANSSVLNRVRSADQNRNSICRESQCDLFPYCLGGCFGNSYSATGELKPWASEYDCYIYKQHTRQKLITMITAAERGTSVLQSV